MNKILYLLFGFFIFLFINIGFTEITGAQKHLVNTRDFKVQDPNYLAAIKASANGDYKKALQLFQKALNQNRNNLAALLGIIEVTLKQEKYNEAGKLLADYHQKYGTNFKFKLEKARYYALTNQAAKAINMIDQLLLVDPTNDTLLDIKDYALARQGNSENSSNTANLTFTKTGAITIWFDDAWLSLYKNAYPLMSQYQFVGAVAIVVNFVNLPKFMTWKQLTDLQQHGWETTSHSMSHQCDLAYYNFQTIPYELIKSQKILKAHGLKANHFVMPCGYTNTQIQNHFLTDYPPIIKTAKTIYKSYRTTATARVNQLPLLDPYHLNAFQVRNNTSLNEVDRMIALAKKQKGWLIIVFHQIDNSKQPFSNTTERLRKILKKIQLSKLPVVTPSQIIK